MFGEDLIIGHVVEKMDSKGRLYMPSYSFVEPHDKLFLKGYKSETEKYLKVIAYQEYIEIIERYKRLRENATTLEEFEKITKKIETTCYTLNSYLTVDKTKRILIPKPVMEQLNWEPNSYYQLDGLGHSLLIRQK